MSLERIFSEENILSYSKACMELGIRIPDTKTHKLDFDTLVIPSRGAVPLFLGMTYALNKLKQFGGEQEDFYNALRVQSILASLLPEELKISDNVEDNKGVKTIVVPFTADFNMEKYRSDENTDEYVSKARDYWARVTTSFFKDGPERRQDPYFRSFTDFILRNLENRGEVASRYEAIPRTQKFSLIDTVISGRASNDILKAFEGIAAETGNPNMNPYAFLIVDENGGKLKKGFRNYLQRKRLQDQADIQEIPRIVSEDEGASLLGVASIVYPSVMRASMNLKLGEKEFFVGAGSWHPGYSISDSHTESFAGFMNLVYSGIDYEFAKDYDAGSEKILYDRLLENRADFLRYRTDNIKNFSIDSVGPILDIFNFNQSYKPESIYETKSHVVHVPFDKDSTIRAIRALESVTGAQYAATKKH